MVSVPFRKGRAQWYSSDLAWVRTWVPAPALLKDAGSPWPLSHLECVSFSLALVFLKSALCSV